VENRVIVRLSPTGPSVQSPFFVSTNRELQPCVLDIVVQMNLASAAESPHYVADRARAAASEFDLVSYIARLFAQTVLPARRRPAGDPLDAEAMAAPLAGAYQPIERQSGAGPVRGVLRVDNSLVDGTFTAKLFLSDRTSAVREGEALKRHLSWERKGVLEKLDMTVATVVRGGDPSPLTLR